MSKQTNLAPKKIEILIVEDSPTQAENLAHILENKGYQVVQARNGKQALACLNGKKPLLVISDIVMPEMNGYELCQRIKGEERIRDIPVILLTSLSDPADVLEGLVCGADSFITKPYSEYYLLARVERTLVDRSSRPSGRAGVDVEIQLAGNSRVITADPQRMLSLLLSTYEAAVHRNTELAQTQDELRSLNELLEDLVRQRTAQLEVTIAKLEQSNRDLQEFAYIASHDLQEPLRKVQAFSDRIATKYTDALDETGRDYLKRMRDASQRMQILINSLLDFSRLSSRAQLFTEVDLKTLAQETLSNLENQIERTQGQVEIGELPTIEADPSQMCQLLQNLISNALKFHDEKRSPIVKVSAKLEGDTCQISVEDNGIGFDIQYLDRIFKPFQRLHGREEYEGSGMGLAICRRIAERHGGNITAESFPVKGSTFIVTLPVHQSTRKS